MKSLKLFLEEVLHNNATTEDVQAYMNEISNSDLYKESENYPYSLKSWLNEIASQYQKCNIDTSVVNMKMLFDFLVQDYKNLVDSVFDVIAKKTAFDVVLDDGRDARDGTAGKLSDIPNVDDLMISVTKTLLYRFRDAKKWQVVLIG